MSEGTLLDYEGFVDRFEKRGEKLYRHQFIFQVGVGFL
jgi:hypothetical protein